YLSLPGNVDLIRMPLLLSSLALCALLGDISRLWRDRAELKVQALFWSGVFLLTVFFLAAYTSAVSWSPQARYLLVAVASFYVLLFCGLSTAIPGRHAAVGAKTLIAFLVIFNLHSLIGVIRPTYAAGRIRFVSGDPNRTFGPLTTSSRRLPARSWWYV